MARSVHPLQASDPTTHEGLDQAFTVVSAATLAICGLYYVGLKSKREEQQDSIYSQHACLRSRQSHGLTLSLEVGDRPLSDSDVSKNSTQVREAMHKTKGT